MKKLITTLLLASPLLALGATEEQLNKEFKVQPDGLIILDVDFGSIDVSTNATVTTVTVDVWRKIGRKNKEAEEKFLKENPVVFSRDRSTIIIRASHPRSRIGWSLWGGERNDARYTITVPAIFSTQLTTSGGGISVRDITGTTKANTSGGDLKFSRLVGPLDGNTSGGGIDVTDCDGTVKVHTSGGGIRVTGGSGSLDGDTSGGSVAVKNFHGKIKGSTSGGSVSAICPGFSTNTVDLSTSGGGVTVAFPGNAAFDLDAETSGGNVSSDLPVTVSGKLGRDHIKGTVNGGGPSVRLRTSGGNVHVNKLRN